MAWNVEAVKLAIKAIGSVESNMRYDSVNYSDPITVGIAQWYGTRAAAVLKRIKTENPSSWTNVTASISNDIDSVASSNSNFWTSRYLTKNEGESLRPVLLANVGIQDNQFADDIDGYLNVAERNGMDKDGNTNGVIFFMVMYHQSPREALRVIASAGSFSNIDRLYTYCLNNTVLGRYKSRYERARNIIKSGDTSGVGTPNPYEPPQEGGDTGSPTRPGGEIKYITQQSDILVVHLASGHSLLAYPNGSGRYVISNDPNRPGADNPGINNPDPIVPPGNISAAQQGLLDWMQQREMSFNYAQATGRLNPDVSGLSDCSGTVWRAYQDVTGIDVGTWTGEQSGKGRTVSSGSTSASFDVQKLRVGDLILYDWNGTSIKYDHVSMYAGNGMCWDHGGPGKGPHFDPVAPKIQRAQRWLVKRHL